MTTEPTTPNAHLGSSGDETVPCIVTTALHFADRVEGQVLHRGTREECEQVARLLPAVSVSGEAPTSARMLVTEAVNAFDMQPGELWRITP